MYKTSHVVRLYLYVLLAFIAFSHHSAAQVNFEFSESAGKVDVSISGSISSLSSFTFNGANSGEAHVFSGAVVGSDSFGSLESYLGTFEMYSNNTAQFTLPFADGTGFDYTFLSFSGDNLSIGSGAILLPSGYTEGQTISAAWRLDTSLSEMAFIANSGVLLSDINGSIVTFTVVPEPGAYSLILGVFAIVLICLRRRA